MVETVDVLIGTIGRAHGLRGEVGVHVRTDEPERRFARGAVVSVGGRSRTVASARTHGGTLLVSFDHVADRTAAEELRGKEIWVTVPADEAPAQDGEYWDRQLVGLEARDASGRPVGRITEVLHHPAHDTLVIEVDATSRLVPFVDALVPVVDLEGGYVQVAEVGGLLTDEEA